MGCAQCSTAAISEDIRVGAVEEGQRARGGAKAVDFDAADSLWEALEGEAVRLVRASWLCLQARHGGVLPRRQECPPEAFLPLAELQDLHSKSDARPYGGAPKRAPIVVVSHFWREPGHPDREGVTLKLLGEALEERMKEYAARGLPDVGVFLDWCSLFQKPFQSPDEERAFKTSLRSINLWYAHALTTVYLFTDTPEGVVPYHERGWTSFEYQLAWLIKVADCADNHVWPQVVDLGRGAKRRPALAAPDAFEEGQAFGNKVFTNGADRGMVAQKFKETCQEVFHSVKLLDFDSLAWGQAEVDALGVVLPLCDQLRVLDLRSNPFTRLPESVGQLPALHTLYLVGCTSLAGIPESLGQLPALRSLDLTGCTSLAGIPESLGQLPALLTLDLTGCTSLAGIPESLGQLPELLTLDLTGCTSLAGIPESLGQLPALLRLVLTGCTSLAGIPESLGQLPALLTLDLTGCTSLAGIPESLGQLPELLTLDLTGCTSLAGIPESVGRRQAAGGSLQVRGP